MSKSILDMSVSLDGYIAGPDDFLCRCVARTRCKRALEAGVLDEVQIHEIPALLGSGRRLFDVLPCEIELESFSGDRHAGGHPYPLPRSSLSLSTGEPGCEWSKVPVRDRVLPLTA